MTTFGMGDWSRPRFDPAAEFVVHAWPLGHRILGGHQPRPGEPFDKTKVGERELARLYDQRWIRMRGEDDNVVVEMKRGPGRPKGSKNKSKSDAAA